MTIDEKYRLLGERGLLTFTAQSFAHNVRKRRSDYDEARALDGDNWLFRRARRNTEKTLRGAEANLERELDKIIEREGITL